MMACAFSHSVFEPVEHRWTWGQYFGPPSTDGAWFELYRNMLIHERDDGTLLLLPGDAAEVAGGRQADRVERAPTYYGPLNFFGREPRQQRGRDPATVEMPGRKRPQDAIGSVPAS